MLLCYEFTLHMFILNVIASQCVVLNSGILVIARICVYLLNEQMMYNQTHLLTHPSNLYRDKHRTFLATFALPMKYSICHLSANNNLSLGYIVSNWDIICERFVESEVLYILYSHINISLTNWSNVMMFVLRNRVPEFMQQIYNSYCKCS